MRRAALALLALLLAGCPSSPTARFYVLNATAPGGARTTACRLQVAAVHLPPALDRPEIVRMAAGNRVAMSDAARWSGPLDAMVREVLSQDLVERCAPETVVLPSAPAAAGTRLLVVTLTRLWPDPDGQLRLVGSWSLVDPTSQAPLLQRDVAIAAGTATTADETAAATSRAVAQLADGIVVAIADRAAAPPAGGAP